MTLPDKFKAIVEKYGFSDYAGIDPKDIVVAQWVRVKCMFGCGDYGMGACPPNVPSVEECEKFFKEYSKGIIIRISKFADKDSYPSSWSKEMTKKLLEIERDIFLMGYHKAFMLNQTCCCICEKCTGSRNECINKKKSRPSPEGFTVDVYETVRRAGMEINVISENPSEMHRIAIMLIE